MKCRTYKSNIIPMPMRPFVLLSWALIVGGTAMMVLAGVPVIIIATALLLFVCWRKPSVTDGVDAPRRHRVVQAMQIPQHSGQGSTDRACAPKQYRPSRRLCWPATVAPCAFTGERSNHVGWASTSCLRARSSLHQLLGVFH